jgi:pilus assembly protein Flp/PilA
MKTIAKFLRDDSGATAIEYGLIAALIAVAIIAAASMLGGQLGNLFNDIGDRLGQTSVDGVGGTGTGTGTP